MYHARMRVAIIIPTFDRPELLQRAVHSALNQTLSPNEVVVVNDRPRIPVSIPDVRVLTTPRNEGPAKARNLALATLTPDTDAVCYLDDDDELAPNHLELLSREMDKGAQFVVSRALYKHPGFDTEDPEPHNKGNKRYYDPTALLEQNIAPVSSFMHSVALGRRIGGWDESLLRMEDWDFWGRMFIEAGPPKYVDAVTNIIHKEAHSNRTDSNAFVYSMACSWRDIVADRLKWLSGQGRSWLIEDDLKRFHIPRVGIVMPVFNAARYLRQAMDSLFVQSYQDFEVLAINDGSTDGSRRILEYYGPKVRIFDLPANMGVTRALNHGLLVSRSELIARMDADDVCLPDRLATQVGFLNDNQDVSIAGTWFYSMSEDLSRVEWDNRTETSTEDVARTMPERCCVGHPTVMMYRRVVETIGGYDESESSRVVEDYELWLRAISRGIKIANVPKHLYLYRNNPNQATRVFAETQKKNFEFTREKYRALIRPHV